MKKLLLSLLLLVSVSVLAQEHMKFKGIPIDGTLKEFSEKIQDKGYNYQNTDKNVAYFSGDFAGYGNCTIFAVVSENTHKVNIAGVMFPKEVLWSRLYDNYSNLKDMLTEKYGEPKEFIEYIDNIIPKDDHERMEKVRNGLCSYYCTFETPYGNIELALNTKDSITCYVLLRYWDKINSKVARNVAMEDL